MYQDPARGPTEVVILFSNQRDYDLDHCVQVVEQALGLDAEGVITSEPNIAPPDVGASVYLVDRDGETQFYCCAPEQVPVVVRTGIGRFPGTAAVGDQRSWVHLSLETNVDTDPLPEQCMLLDRLTAGFMEEGAFQLYVPQQNLFVPTSDALRDALFTKPLADVLTTARPEAPDPRGSRPSA